MRQEKKRFLVYALIDPRDGSVFYYGKGTSSRPRSHVSEYRSGRISNPRKHAKIGAILDAGFKVKVRVVAQGLTSAGALALERKLIAENFSEITNWWRGSKDREDLQGGCYRCYLRVQKERIEDLIRRLRPMRDWVKLTCRAERRRPTPDDINEWLETRDWLVGTHAMIEQKIDQFN